MMGYLKPLAPDARVRGLFRSYQCGLCHTIGAEYGFAYRLLAGPDLVFYNVFLDLLGGGEAPVESRACVVAPGVTRLPSRVRTESTRLAAAFGVYMAVEKLKDNWHDDGGWHRWLAWRAFSPGHARARAHLASVDFPLAEVEGWMGRQAEIERGDALPLGEAAAPSTEIARLSFGVAGRDDATRSLAGEVGARIGGFLFYMDNALDLRRDLDEGGYNALARAFGLQDAAEVSPPVYAAGLDGARAQILALEPLVQALPVTDHRAYLSQTLVWGFRDKVRRFERLSGEQRAGATLRSLLPPPLPWTARARAAVATPANRVWMRAQLLVALLLFTLFPKRSWADDWWPEDTGALGLDTAMPDTGDTGLRDTGPVDPGLDGSDRSGLSEWICNPCLSSCGFAECDPVNGCENVCDEACSSTCDATCGNACDDACEGACDPNCEC